MLKKNRTMIAVFLLPAVLCYLLVFLYPVLRTLIMSFFAVESVSDRISQWRFTGFGNYIRLFSAGIFRTSLYNIARIWLVGGIAVMCVSLFFAAVLTDKSRINTFLKSVVYLPNVVSAVAMGTMWINYVYNPDYGLLNNFFRLIGLDDLGNTLWTSPGHLFWSMLAAYCFGMVGYHMLIFISGMEQISKEYYEAAIIEGASALVRFFCVSLPFLRGVIRTNIVMWTIYTVSFFVWGQLFSPVNLSNDTVAPVNYMYELVFGSSSSAAAARDAGAGAAVGVIMMCIVIVFFGLTSLITKNDDIEV